MGDLPTPDPVHPSSLLRTPDLHARTPTVRHSLHTTIQKGSSMSTKIYVGNLPYSVTDSSLQSNFAEFGGVSSAKVMMDRETGRSKGFGFVEMASAEVAQAAISALHGMSVDGRRSSGTWPPPAKKVAARVATAPLATPRASAQMLATVRAATAAVGTDPHTFLRMTGSAEPVFFCPDQGTMEPALQGHGAQICGVRTARGPQRVTRRPAHNKPLRQRASLPQKYWSNWPLALYR